jgi:16S rRNA processing protein RimM
MSLDQEPIILGKIGAVWGVRGWVKVKTYTRKPGDILFYDHWLLKRTDGWQEVALIGGHPQGDSVVVELEGFNDREFSQELNGVEVGIRQDQLSQHQSEFYWIELEEMEVVTLKGISLGRVTSLMETGANDVLVVTDQEGNERLIPWGESVVDSVDRHSGKIRVDWEADY